MEKQLYDEIKDVRKRGSEVLQLLFPEARDYSLIELLEALTVTGIVACCIIDHANVEAKEKIKKGFIETITNFKPSGEKTL